MSSVDALMIINLLNRFDAEGESLPQPTTLSSVHHHDVVSSIEEDSDEWDSDSQLF